MEFMGNSIGKIPNENFGKSLAVKISSPTKKRVMK
jgi:hypothetical protein